MATAFQKVKIQGSARIRILRWGMARHDAYRRMIIRGFRTDAGT
jgi:hypothetical protein